MIPELGYYSFRGYGQPIRYLLEYTDTVYEEKQYDIGPGPCYLTPEWTAVKGTLGLEHPSLPYYIDAEVRLTDSVTILRHLAKKAHLDASDPDEVCVLEEAVRLINDRNGALDMMFYTTNYESDMDNFISSIGPTMETFSATLGLNKFIVGNKITFVDFMLYEILERYELLDDSCLFGYDALQDFRWRIQDLPPIKRYINSPPFRKIKERLNARMARCGVGWHFPTEKNL